jgi:hypothetical protein
VLQEHAQQLSVLSERWRNLEERIKEAEQISGTVVIPAINELRYSGRRFFEAWLLTVAKSEMTEQDMKDFSTHVIMAVQYFNNADHDLTDSLVMFFTKRMEQILNRYGLLRCTEMHPRMVIWMDTIKRCQDIIRASRGNRQDRITEYDRLRAEYLPKIQTQYHDIIFSERLYLTKLRWQIFFSVLGYIVGVVGTAAAVLSLWLEWDRLTSKVAAFFH